MILGVDHLAFAVTDTFKAKEELERQGFICSFLEESVENNVAKKPLLSRYESVHDLGLFIPQDAGIPVEITNHGPALADNYFFHITDNSIGEGLYKFHVWGNSFFEVAVVIIPAFQNTRKILPAILHLTDLVLPCFGMYCHST